MLIQRDFTLVEDRERPVGRFRLEFFSIDDIGHKMLSENPSLKRAINDVALHAAGQIDELLYHEWRRVREHFNLVLNGSPNRTPADQPSRKV